MARGLRRRFVMLALAAPVGLAWPGGTAGADTPPGAEGGGSERMERIEDQMQLLKDELAALKRERAVDQAKVAEVEQELEGLQGLLQRVDVGGYGSVRWQNDSLGEQEDTFTFRRLVFTTGAQITRTLRFYSELEFERFRKLELERGTTFIDASEGGPGLEVKQAVEGTNDSEIALEQAWLEWEIDPRLRLQVGGVLVPLGRFNINHDDNQWNLPRRPLVDRGVAVLPSTSAWDELGAGFTGHFDVGEGSIDYRIYVVNGVAIEPEVEEIIKTRANARDVLELEAEFSPQTGTFSNDTKEAKATTGRLAWSPRPGHEIAISYYHGRYTPELLGDRNVTSFAVDGITRVAGLEIEGEFASTHWGGIDNVAENFARSAIESATANPSAFDPLLEPEIEFELEGVAKRLSGYWIELRYPFWLAGLPRGEFRNPKLIPTVRWEQVFFNDRLASLGFQNGQVTEVNKQDSRLHRATVGMAFRPTPLVVFTAAWETTWTDEKSLDGLTNFLTAREEEENQHVFMLGASFGF